MTSARQDPSNKRPPTAGVTSTGRAFSHLDADDPELTRAENDALELASVTETETETQTSYGRTSYSVSVSVTPDFILEAAQEMTTDDLPEGVDELSDMARPLLGLCREMSRMGDGGVFWLTCRHAADAVGHPDRYRRCHRLLTRWFPARGWLEIVEQGKRGRANRYRCTLAPVKGLQ